MPGYTMILYNIDMQCKVFGDHHKMASALESIQPACQQLRTMCWLDMSTVYGGVSLVQDCGSLQPTCLLIHAATRS